MSIFDLPAHPPRGPDGKINIAQLRYEYYWRHRGMFGVADGYSVSNGNRVLTQPPTFNEYLEAVLKGALCQI